MTGALDRALAAAVASIEAVGVRYAVVGGLAVGAWGVSRSTRDVDLYADLAATTPAALQAALEERGFHVPAMQAELERFGVFRSRSAEGIFLDVFPAVGPLGDAILARRVEVALGGRSLYVIAPDDLAVLKAFSERERDFEDLANLAAVLGPKLDVAYVEGWARRLDESIGGDDVSDRVRRALARHRGGGNRSH